MFDGLLPKLLVGIAITLAVGLSILLVVLLTGGDSVENSTRDSEPTEQPTIIATPSPTPLALISSPSSCATTYVVESGDNISDIAANFDVPPDSVILDNGIREPRLVQTGEVLLIRCPVGEGESSGPNDTDDRPKLAFLYRSLSSCIQEELASSSGSSTCLLGIPRAQDYTSLDSNVNQLLDQISGEVGAVDCVFSETLALFAFVSGSSAALSVSEQYEVRNADNTTKFVRVIYRFEAAKIDTDWLITGWIFHFVDEIVGDIEGDAKPC